MGCVTRLSLSGASARAARAADPIFSKSSDTNLVCAAGTACDVMSTVGAGLVVSVCIGSGRQDSGRPMRWLVTITGDERDSSVALATNSNAISA